MSTFARPTTVAQVIGAALTLPADADLQDIRLRETGPG
jgi:hypothetical protein